MNEDITKDSQIRENFKTVNKLKSIETERDNLFCELNFV
jgi:hypothetical protein